MSMRLGELAFASSPVNGYLLASLSLSPQRQVPQTSITLGAPSGKVLIDRNFLDPIPALGNSRKNRDIPKNSQRLTVRWGQ